MRVSTKILEFFYEEIKKYSSNFRLYLFGSRIDDAKKGGDIDILILSEKKIKLIDKIKIRTTFYRKFGEQKVDLVNFTYNEKSAFKSYILETAIEI